MDNIPHGHTHFCIYFQIIDTPSGRVTRDTIEFVIIRVCKSGEFAEVINIEDTDMETAKRFAELSVSLRVCS